MDNVSKHKRSQIMSRVKSSGNKSTEEKFISILKKNKLIGWRRKYPLLGKPDFVFPSFRLAIFIDGCFWHKCPKHFRLPSSNTKYWIEKINKNQKRDKLLTRKLKNKGWKVVRVWEHELKGGSSFSRKINQIKRIFQQ